jgi:hypothetical protein
MRKEILEMTMPRLTETCKPTVQGERKGFNHEQGATYPDISSNGINVSRQWWAEGFK